MKKIFVAILLLLLPVGVFAGGNMAGKKYVTLPAGETVEGNYYAAGERVDIFGDVDGDLIVAGGMVNISGNVTGDVITAGGNVSVSGIIQGDLRVAGGDVEVSSVIGKNATVFAGNFELEDGSAVGESLDVFAGAVNLDGSVDDNLRVATGALVITGSVGDDIWAKVGEVEQFVLQSTAIVGGDINYTSPTAAKVISGADVQGEFKYSPFEKKMAPTPDAAFPIAGLLFGVFAFFKFSVWLGFLVLGLLLLYFAPKVVEMTHKEITKRFWPSFGWGLFVMILGPVLIGVLFSTLILWPVAVVVALFYVLYLFSSVVIASTYIGEWVLAKFQKKRMGRVSMRWSLVLGLTLLMLISMIPFIGWLFKCIAMATAIGAIKAVDIKELKRYR